mgnify:CR=1 FL=1
MKKNITIILRIPNNHPLENNDTDFKETIRNIVQFHQVSKGDIVEINNTSIILYKKKLVFVRMMVYEVYEFLIGDRLPEFQSYTTMKEYQFDKPF